MKKKWKIGSICLLLFVCLLCHTVFQKKHTFTLSVQENRIAEQIQPLRKTIRVTADRDTDVRFMDMETGKEYTIGYLTPGLTEQITLEKGKWYTVEANGILTVWPVNVRIE